MKVIGRRAARTRTGGHSKESSKSAKTERKYLKLKKIYLRDIGRRQWGQGLRGQPCKAGKRRSKCTTTACTDSHECNCMS